MKNMLGEEVEKQGLEFQWVGDFHLFAFRNSKILANVYANGWNGSMALIQAELGDLLFDNIMEPFSLSDMQAMVKEFRKRYSQKACVKLVEAAVAREKLAELRRSTG